MTRVEIQNNTPKLKRSSSHDAVDLLVFLIPCLRFVQLKAVGVLSGTDMLILIVFLYLICRWRIHIESSTGKWLIALCSLWLVSQCVTDIVRHSAFIDYARGWSNIGMTIAYLAVLWTLFEGKPRRIVLYGWGLVLGTILTVFISPDYLMLEDPWKFGLGTPVTLALFLFASRKECSGLWPAILSAAMGVLNIVLGIRSLGGACLVASLYLLVTHSMRKKGVGMRTLKATTMLKIMASIVIGFAGILWVYQFAASRGILGEDARSKYEIEASGQYGILLGGRTELLGSIPAIYDSPILGHGSWAKDPTYLLIEQQGLALMGYSMADEIPEEEIKEGLIPSHSYLFGAWVDSGILGAVFWGWVGFMTIKVLMRVHPPSVVLLPLMAFAAFSLLWDILFSPYGAPGRAVSPYCIVLLMVHLSNAPHTVAQVALSTSKPIPAPARG